MLLFVPLCTLAVHVRATLLSVLSCVGQVLASALATEAALAVAAHPCHHHPHSASLSTEVEEASQGMVAAASSSRATTSRCGCGDCCRLCWHA